MKQLKELARLKFGLGRSYSEIAGSLGVARSSVRGLGSNGTVNRLKRSEASPSGFEVPLAYSGSTGLRSGRNSPRATDSGTANE